jgi:PKD repeat protein
VVWGYRTGDTSKAGDPLVFTLTQEKGLTDDTLYTWDFGDGVSVSGVGLQDYGVQTHSYDKEGTYTVVVTASNENGASTVSLTISIGDLAPGTLNITITGDTSKAGNSLVFTLTQEKGLMDDTLYMWDFGDGVNVSGVGLQDYGVQTHSYDKEGTYTVEVTASNGDSVSTASLTITIGVQIGKITGKTTGSNKLGVNVGVPLAGIIIVAIVALLVGVLWWYQRRYKSLAMRYQTLQEGAVPMTLSKGELQEDFSYSKDEEADDVCLVSEKKEQ